MKGDVPVVYVTPNPLLCMKYVRKVIIPAGYSVTATTSLGPPPNRVGGRLPTLPDKNLI